MPQPLITASTALAMRARSAATAAAQSGAGVGAGRTFETAFARTHAVRALPSSTDPMSVWSPLRSILSEARWPSPYLADIESRERLAAIDWSELPAVSGPGDPRVEVRVYLSYHARNAREQVKGLRYRWNPRQRYWARSLVADGFDPDLLLGQEWAVQAERVVIIDESGETLRDRRLTTTPAADEARSGTA